MSFSLNAILLTKVAILIIAGYVLFTPNNAFALTDISNCTDLQNIDSNLAEDYRLTQNIDCTGVANFNIIGSSVAPFTGTFDGQGYTVDGVTISGSAGYEAPFARNNGTIQDVGFTNVDIDSTKTSFAHVAGLVAQNYGTIQNSYTTGDVNSAGWYVGGLVGANESGATIHQSYSSANVTAGGPRAGGLTGENEGGTITESYATGNVTSSTNQVGGLVGIQFNASSSISDSYSTGNVTGDTSVGGFIGYHDAGSITNSYTSGSATAGDYPFGVGGGSVTSSYYDGDVNSGDATTNAIGTEKTTPEMKDQSTFVNWNFSTIWGISSGANNGYPFLRFQGFDVAPSISTLSPADNASNVGVNDNLVITFDEVVDVETGNIVIYQTSDDAVFETIDVTSGKVSGSGTLEITINPDNSFSEGVEYYVLIDATAFDDVTGNSFAGISSSTDWSFTVPDVTNPSISTLSPADNAVSIAIDSDLVITFDEVVDAESGNILLYKSSDDSLVESFDVTSDIAGTGTTQITINPAADLEAGTEYYVLIDATAFDDVTGNSFAGISSSTTWSFTTVDDSMTGGSAMNTYKAKAKPAKEKSDTNVSDESNNSNQEINSDDSYSAKQLNNFNKSKSNQIPDSEKSLTKSYVFNYDLHQGMFDKDVIKLQQFLNKNGFILAIDGAGSLGNETNYFGQLTKQALIKFQEANADQILAPLGLVSGTGYFGLATRNFVND